MSGAGAGAERAVGAVLSREAGAARGAAVGGGS